MISSRSRSAGGIRSVSLAVGMNSTSERSKGSSTKASRKRSFCSGSRTSPGTRGCTPWRARGPTCPASSAVRTRAKSTGAVVRRFQGSVLQPLDSGGSHGFMRETTGSKWWSLCVETSPDPPLPVDFRASGTDRPGTVFEYPKSVPFMRAFGMRESDGLTEPPEAALCRRSASADVVASIVRSDCYRLERQLPGGIRTRCGMAPCHGAPESCAIDPKLRRQDRDVVLVARSGTSQHV